MSMRVCAGRGGKPECVAGGGLGEEMAPEGVGEEGSPNRQAVGILRGGQASKELSAYATPLIPPPPHRVKHDPRELGVLCTLYKLHHLEEKRGRQV